MTQVSLVSILLVLFSCSINTATITQAHCLPDQRQALIQLKQGFTTTQLDSWNAATDCCIWDGIKCDEKTGMVTAINLADRHISGELNPVLFSLSSLQYLNLAGNQFNNLILPQTGFEQLANLTHLDLSNSGFVGQVPIGICALTKLILLNLSGKYSTNTNTMSIHDTCLLSNLTKLQVLRLDGIDISPSVSEWRNTTFHLTNLQELSMSDCQLRGNLPNEIFHLTNLTLLDLSDNPMLSGQLPKFTRQSFLQKLYLQNCSFYGEISPSITNLTRLEYLELSSNRLSASKFFSGGKSRPRNLIIIISLSVSFFIIGCFLGFLLIRKLRYIEPDISQEAKMLATNNKTLMDLWIRERSSDFPLFDFNQIENATGKFSLDNKLGEGGFGPVYKGVLQDGLEIAVKRLSSYSGQGLVEFKNEIQVIAKLQHRNLVRLVGCCIQGEEKILIYEFMPNKSLDYFILDKRRGALLNWERRFEIIKGIAQGLLYLHQHSRLRIVHRDLKASNILLDSEMNPKISDFGLARIFGPKELQANTNRVVGTYGYMAPEYASEGLFSIKSDVFSFGVLLLEIVSGKRNTGFHQEGEFLNLLGYAWYKWKGGNIPELICPTLTEVPQRQAERCIHVGLLCVQENPTDRPIMSDVIVFLTTESIILPEPKQPAYFNMRVKEEAVDPSNFNGSACSINYVTLTNPEVR